MYGSFASGTLSYGISLIYGYVGSTCYTDIYLFLWMDIFSGNDLSLTLVYGFTLLLPAFFLN